MVYEENSQFDEFLLELFENKEDFSRALQSYRKFESENIVDITSLMYNLLAMRENGREKEGTIKKLGKKDDIENEIKNIDNKLKDINKAGKKINSQELENYKKINAEKSIQTQKLKILITDINSLGFLKKKKIITS